jgi:hypothetical protein
MLFFFKKNIYLSYEKNIGLSCSSTATGVAGGKPIRKIPKRNIQQLVAQPSTTSTSTILKNLRKTLM